MSFQGSQCSYPVDEAFLLQNNVHQYMQTNKAATLLIIKLDMLIWVLVEAEMSCGQPHVASLCVTIFDTSALASFGSHGD